MKTIVIILGIPLFAIGWVAGVIGRPLFIGYMNGHYFLEGKECERVLKELGENDVELP